VQRLSNDSGHVMHRCVDVLSFDPLQICTNPTTDPQPRCFLFAQPSICRSYCEIQETRQKKIKQVTASQLVIAAR